MDKVDVLIILNRGTLVNYFVEPSFIKVYYSSPDLEKDTYYLFTFLTSTQSLIKAQVVSFVGLKKRRDKRYFDLIQGLVKDLVSDYNSGQRGNGGKLL